MSKWSRTKALLGMLMVAGVVNASAAFDATVEVTSAGDTLGTIFGIVFTAILAIVLGKKALTFFRGA